jgi:PleD family two-component response regulator
MKKQVIAVVEDLMFESKIRGAAAQAGAEVRFVKTADALLEAAQSDGPAVVILDLQTSLVDPFAAAEMLKADELARGVSVVGFFPHVQADLQRRAQAAGIEHVMPRSVFNQRLLEIVGGEL